MKKEDLKNTSAFADGDVFEIEAIRNQDRVIEGKLYFRVYFSLNGKEYSVRSNFPRTGKGSVRFCKAGSIAPTGKPVVADCFAENGWEHGITTEQVLSTFKPQKVGLED